VVRRFKQDIAGLQETANLVFPTPVPERSIPGGAIAFVGVAIAVLAYGGWYASTSDQRLFVELIAPLPEKLARLLPGADEPTAPALPAEEVATAPEPKTVPTDDGADVQRTGELAANGPVAAAHAERVTIDPPLPAVQPAPAPVVVVEPVAMSVLDAPVPSGTTVAEAPSVLVTAAQLETVQPNSALEISSSDPPAAVLVDGDGAATDPNKNPTPIPNGSGDAAAMDPNENGAAIPDGGGEDTSPAVVGAGVVRTATGNGSEIRPGQSGGLSDPPLERASIGGAPAEPYPESVVVRRGPVETSQTSAGRDRRTDSDLATLTGALEAPVPAASAPLTEVMDAPSLGERAETPDVQFDLDATSPPMPSEEVAGLVEDAAEAPLDALGRDASGQEPTDGDAPEIVVRAKMSSWIQIRDDAGNQPLMTRLMRAGDTYRAPDRPGLRLLTGNAGALEILVGGEEAPAIGPVGAVRRDVVLDPQRLLNGTATTE
jgi:cytoskeleton protein RodZ